MIRTTRCAPRPDIAPSFYFRPRPETSRGRLARASVATSWGAALVALAAMVATSAHAEAASAVQVLPLKIDRMNKDVQKNPACGVSDSRHCEP